MKERPIIIVGCPRSGTTLLSTMLHSHPRLAIAPETRFLLPVYNNRLRFGDLSEPANLRRLARAITSPRRRHTADLGLNRRATVRAITSGPPTIGSAFATVFSEFARSRGKARWGDKRPKYWRSMSSLHRLFPDAQFVHLIRDPRSCVASLLAAPWWRHGLEHSLTTWLLAERELRRFERSVPGDSYHVVRYEDLLTDPARTLEDLTTFLGEEFDAAMLTSSRAASDIVPARMAWHDRTRGDLDPARVAAWQAALPAEAIGLIEREARRAMRRHGYAPSNTGNPPHFATRVRFRAEYLRHDAILRREQLVEHGRRRREIQPVAATTRR